MQGLFHSECSRSATPRSFHSNSKSDTEGGVTVLSGGGGDFSYSVHRIRRRNLKRFMPGKRTGLFYDQ